MESEQSIVPTLQILSGPLAGRLFKIDRDLVVIGRNPDCDLVLAPKSVSRRHAQIAHDGQGWVLTDLGSSNGTWVDGGRINGPHRVSSATTIRLGMQQQGADITVEPLSESVTTPAADPPTSLDGDRIPQDDDTRLFGTGAVQDAGTALRAKLGGTTVTLPAVPGKRYTVGRDPDADLSTDEEIVSRNHLELAWDGELWTATDLSARGTFTTDAKPTRLPKGIATPLATSTTLRLGGAATGEPLSITISTPLMRLIRGNRRRP
jgi:pSer/pThr/pTyr-binding forkhead associated (FHA) protein